MAHQRKTVWGPPPMVDPLDPRIKRWDNGLILHEEFISTKDEADAISAIVADTRWAGIGKRQTLHFGPHFDYTTNTASETDSTPLPSYLTDLIPHLPLFDGDAPAADPPESEPSAFVPDQFTVQYYPPGCGIPPHVDTHSAFREALYCLSLGSQVPMVFRKCGRKEAMTMRKPKRCFSEVSSVSNSDLNDTKPFIKPVNSEGAAKLNGEKPIAHHFDQVQRAETVSPETEDSEEKEEQWDLILPPRSLLIMTGPSRYGYTHRIRGRKMDTLMDGTEVERKGRYSITMRTVVRDGTPCICGFPGVCDTRVREELFENSFSDQTGNY